MTEDGTGGTTTGAVITNADDIDPRHCYSEDLHMMLVIINMKVSAEKRRELSQTVASLINTISGEKGCGRCDFFQRIENENLLCLLEEWDTPNNFEKHRKSECFKVFRGAMTLLDEPYELISYLGITQTSF